MKISSDHVSAVEQQQQSEHVQARQAEGGGFGELLAKELGASPASAQESAGIKPLGVNPLLLAQVPAVEKPQAGGRIVDSLENLLSEWEDYAGRLEAQGDAPDLKDAYRTLSRIGGEIERLKAEHPDLASKSPQLKSLVDELEVMSVTETFKFNRGDYT